MPTVYDVWRLALPAATTVATLNGNLRQVVSWVHRMSTNTPAFGALDENDLVILSVANIKLVDDRLTLEKIIESFAVRGISAIALLGEISHQDITAADKHGISLLVLPAGTDLRDVEHDVVRLIVEREAQLDRRGRQIYRQLAQHSLENRGLEAVAVALQSIVMKSVVIQDKNLDILASSFSDSFPYKTRELDVLMSNTITLHKWISHETLDSKAPPSTILNLPDSDWARCTTAIVIEDQLVGYLSVLGPIRDLDALDRLAVERGSLVCAVEMAKQRAVVAMEHQLRGDFVDMVLTAGVTEVPALNRRAIEMGYPLNRQHIAVVFSLNQDVSRLWSIIASEFRTTLLDSGIQVFLCSYEDKLVSLCGYEGDIHEKTLMMYAYQTCDRVKQLVPDVKIAIGIGKPGYGLVGLRRSFIQACEVLDLIQAHYQGDKVLVFGDLGLYHLLHYLQNCDELDDFYSQTLAPLVIYDGEHDSSLVKSLETFFNHHGNISQTAETLHLHRNSLLYRLERINEITGMNLDDADDRFALQLALKLKPFVASCT